MGLKALLDKCFTKDDRTKVFDNLVRLSAAKIPDLDAIKLLLAYTYGRPTEHHEITGQAGGTIILEWMDDTGSSNEN